MVAGSRGGPPAGSGGGAEVSGPHCHYLVAWMGDGQTFGFFLKQQRTVCCSAARVISSTLFNNSKYLMYLKINFSLLINS